MARRREPGREEPAATTIRVVLVDAYPLMIRGLLALFENQSGIEIVATATSSEEALGIVEREDPDVVLLDADLPPSLGVDTLDAIRSLPWTGKIILHASSVDHRQALEAIRQSVPGVILKTMDPELLVRCVRRINEGHHWLEKDSLTQVLEVILRREDEKQKIEDRLTPREAEVVRLAATGLANKNIAQRLSISTSTVKTHLHNIYEKLEVDGRWELSAFARDRDI